MAAGTPGGVAELGITSVFLRTVPSEPPRVPLGATATLAVVLAPAP
ncbi:hypothetical protein [Streptacidiphilus sp. MAP5-3]